MKTCPKCGTPRMMLMKDTDGSYLRCSICGTHVDVDRNGVPMALTTGNGPWLRLMKPKLSGVSKLR